MIVAVPLWPPAMKRTFTCPLVVRASDGSIRPIVVVKETSVPFCTGVPAPAVVVVVVPVVPVPFPFQCRASAGPVDAVATPFSITVAMISTLPSTGTVDAPGKSVITVPGRREQRHFVARRGDQRGQENRRDDTASEARGRRDCVSMGNAKDNTLMYLERQDGERGYAMAALLVTLAVMSVLLSAALPAWRHEAQREKEAELVFRGEQYARAVALFRAKNENAFPPSVDVLVQGRFLRKKYLDPITNKDFDVIGVGTQTPPDPGTQTPGGTRRARRRAGRPRHRRASAPAAPRAVSGGIMGVHSKSQETSIRIYKGQSRYDQWNFVFTAMNRPGGNDPGALNPGGRGGAAGSGRQRRTRPWRSASIPAAADAAPALAADRAGFPAATSPPPTGLNPGRGGAGILTPGASPRGRRPLHWTTAAFGAVGRSSEPDRLSGSGGRRRPRPRRGPAAAARAAARCRASGGRGWSAARRRDRAPSRSRATCR